MQMPAYQSVSYNSRRFVHLSYPVGQRILAVDHIYTYYVPKWKMKAIQICLCGMFHRHQHHQ